MAQRRSASASRRPANDAVFLNLPYDDRFAELFLAYVAGVSAFGLVPRATLEIPGGERRLSRIWDLIRGSRYSIYDMSRVELDLVPPATPRFNMPFELGLAVAYQQSVNKNRNKQHTWFVFEGVNRRLQKSLSDLNGTEVYIHDGTAEGVFRELAQAFVTARWQPSVAQIRIVHGRLRAEMPRLLEDAGSATPFQARVFRDCSVFANAVAEELLGVR